VLNKNFWDKILSREGATSIPGVKIFGRIAAWLVMVVGGSVGRVYQVNTGSLAPGGHKASFNLAPHVYCNKYRATRIMKNVVTRIKVQIPFMPSNPAMVVRVFAPSFYCFLWINFLGIYFYGGDPLAFSWR